MRVIAIVFALLCTFSLFSGASASANPTYHSAFANMAPADEYFGRQKESILEIRNRLDAFDRRSDEEMLDPGTVHALDDLQDAIRDWEHKYPRDPWLPESLRRLLRDYQRAGAASTEEASDVVATLQSNYGDTDSAIAVSNVYAPGEPPGDDTSPSENAPQSVSVSGTVVDAQSGQPVAGAIVIVAPQDGSLDASADTSATTGDDGTFVISGAPAAAINLVVQPPDGSGYAPYTLSVDGSSGDVDAGVIRLSLE